VLPGPGSTVRAGTLNCGSGVLRVRTTAAAGDTAVARMAALVEQAASQQSPAEALVARVRAALCCAVLRRAVLCPSSVFLLLLSCAVLSLRQLLQTACLFPVPAVCARVHPGHPGRLHPARLPALGLERRSQGD